MIAMSSPFDLQTFLQSHPPRNGRFHTVAVDGRGGSGKTDLGVLLSQLLPDYLMLNGDDYFEPLADELAWGDFNEPRFARDVVTPLMQGLTSLSYQPYDFALDALEPVKEQHVDRGVVIERCFTFGMPIDWDLRIWVETPREVCLARGIARDHLPRDRVIAVWTQLWQPREDHYIQAIRPGQSADLVVNGTRPFRDQITG